MVVGMVLDNTGRPLCCELWPGNTTDVKTLIPVVNRMRRRFGVSRVCIVADRGMISASTIAELQSEVLDCRYILGARLRRVKEVNREVLSRAGRYHVVHGRPECSKDPSPLKVKEVWVQDRRYVVCYNEDQARKDRADREAIIAHLQDALRQGDKSLVGNKGYRRYLSNPGPDHFQIDREKVRAEGRYDGKWVLRTDTDLSAADVALKYKELWMVENIFRQLKSIIRTRPIYHHHKETIRGHVFCSFLALLLLKELFERLAAKGWADVEWARLKNDLDDVERFEMSCSGKTFDIRTDLSGDATKAFRAAGVAPGPVIREVTP
jgi:transposase